MPLSDITLQHTSPLRRNVELGGMQHAAVRCHKIGLGTRLKIPSTASVSKFQAPDGPQPLHGLFTSEAAEHVVVEHTEPGLFVRHRRHTPAPEASTR